MYKKTFSPSDLEQLAPFITAIKADKKQVTFTIKGSEADVVRIRHLLYSWLRANEKNYSIKKSGNSVSLIKGSYTNWKGVGKNALIQRVPIAEVEVEEDTNLPLHLQELAVDIALSEDSPDLRVRLDSLTESERKRVVEKAAIIRSEVR